MKKQMYAILDHTAQVFLNPITFTNDGDAIRWFTTVVNNSEEQNNINKYPESFTLFRLADWNDQTGAYEPREKEADSVHLMPKQLITGIQVQQEQLKSFTVKDLIAILKSELQLDNVIDIAEKKQESK